MLQGRHLPCLGNLRVGSGSIVYLGELLHHWRPFCGFSRLLGGPFRLYEVPSILLLDWARVRPVTVRLVHLSVLRDAAIMRWSDALQ